MENKRLLTQSCLPGQACKPFLIYSCLKRDVTIIKVKQLGFILGIKVKISKTSYENSFPSSVFEIIIPFFMVIYM